MEIYFSILSSKQLSQHLLDISGEVYATWSYGLILFDLTIICDEMCRIDFTAQIALQSDGASP